MAVVVLVILAVVTLWCCAAVAVGLVVSRAICIARDPEAALVTAPAAARLPSPRLADERIALDDAEQRAPA